MPSVLSTAAASDGGRVAIDFVGGPNITYGELLNSVMSIAGSLQAVGVTKGDRVALMSTNRLDYLQCWFAVHALGAIAVPLNVALRGSILAHMLRLADPTVLIAEPVYLPELAKAAGDSTNIQTVVLLGQAPAGQAEFRRQNMLDFSDIVSSRSTFKAVDVDVADPCCILYTSGTTGPSKGCVWTHGTSIHTADIVCENMRYQRDDVLHTCLPLFHANALHLTTLPGLSVRARVAIGARFDPTSFWRDLDTSGATATMFIGSICPTLLRLPESTEEKRHHLRTAVVMPAPAEYYQLLPKRWGIRPVEAYGMSDVGMPLWSPIHEAARPGSCGIPTRGFECRLVDEHDDEVAPGSVGELVVRPKQPWIMTAGYWGMPEATIVAWRNFWMHTGDLMRRSEDGWYYFLDRTKDYIRRRGENVSSVEVEQVVLTHPSVLECAVYGLASELGEEDVAVAVVLASGCKLDPVELLMYLEPRLPYFAVPRFVRFLDELPKTQTQKVQKLPLRSDGRTPDTWDRRAAGYRLRRA